MKRIMTVLEGYLTFGQGEDSKPLTYARVKQDIHLAENVTEAAMDTDHECTADTWSAPPIHRSLDPDNRPTTAPRRLVTKRFRLQ